MTGSGGQPLWSWIFQDVRIRQVSGATILSMMLCWGFLNPLACAGGFFDSLWLPALWALATVALLDSSCWVVRVAGFAALLLPVAATYIHYAVALASHRSFVFAGVLPWSDAYMHFVQAAQMAQDGVTIRPFNGRFLYPGFFSTLLRVCAYNLQVAHLGVGVIFACGLYAAVRAMLGRTGLLGAALFTLLLWLYWRDHGASLVMTEQLGAILGILALPPLLAMSCRRNVALLLLAIFLLAVGFSARPGALFVLPMLVIFAGWTGWSGWSVPAMPKLLRALAVAFIATGISVAGFLSNNVIQKIAFRGDVVPYGNFAYTLNGLINGTTWQDSYVRYHGNPLPVMEENEALLRQHPVLLLKGVFRAYVRAVSIKFLYAFDSENRLAAISWIFAIVALIALWRDPGLRDDALWISLFGSGIILSIPFAPPWDAGIRSYAVTIPFQAFLAAFGAGVCMRGVVRWLGVTMQHDQSYPPSVKPVTALACLVLLMTLVAPVIHARASHGVSTAAHHSGVLFIPGSSVTLDEESFHFMRSGLDSIASWFRIEAKCLQLLRPGCGFGINWNDLGRYALLPGASDFVECGRMKADVKLLPLREKANQ